MRILIVNKFFSPRGGDCVVAMATRRLLLDMGHDVRIFAMDYPANTHLPETSGFASEVSFSGSIQKKIHAALRLLGKGNIRHTAEAVLDSFQPDVVHLHNVHSYLSPLIGELAHRRGIRVVWTLHDYKLLCPSYSCRRPSGENCEECFAGTLNVIRHACMKGSRIHSLLADIEARVWNRRRLEAMTDLFIAPSEFMRNKMLEGGFPRKKITTVCNFIDPLKMEMIEEAGITENPQDYFCYVGRLSDEKGTETMLAAAAEAGVNLKVAGDGPLLPSIRRKYEGTPGISLLGHLGHRQIVSLLRSAKASVLPSEWYENNPLGVIESLCCGTPVIGAAIGGIPELLNKANGITFTSGNTEELTSIFRNFDHRHSFPRHDIADDARTRFRRDTHYDLLMKAYSDASAKHS